MGKTIIEFKEQTNKSVRDLMAVIIRNGKVLNISNSHPRFVEAKREEVSRIQREAHPSTENQHQNSDEKQARLAQELMDEVEVEMKEPEEVPKSKPKRRKAKTKRILSPEPTPEKETTSSSVSIYATVIDPTVNFHGDPIMPKEEPMNFDSIEVPSFLLNPKQKKRAPKKQLSKGPVQVARVPAIVKQPILENKEDFIYQAEIEEYSGMNLYLDELSEVRGIDKYKN